MSRKKELQKQIEDYQTAKAFFDKYGEKYFADVSATHLIRGSGVREVDDRDALGLVLYSTRLVTWLSDGVGFLVGGHGFSSITTSKRFGDHTPYGMSFGSEGVNVPHHTLPMDVVYGLYSGVRARLFTGDMSQGRETSPGEIGRMLANAETKLHAQLLRTRTNHKMSTAWLSELIEANSAGDERMLHRVRTYNCDMDTIHYFERHSVCTNPDLWAWDKKKTFVRGRHELGHLQAFVSGYYSMHMGHIRRATKDAVLRSLDIHVALLALVGKALLSWDRESVQWGKLQAAYNRARRTAARMTNRWLGKWRTNPRAALMKRFREFGKFGSEGHLASSELGAFILQNVTCYAEMLRALLSCKNIFNSHRVSKEGTYAWIDGLEKYMADAIALVYLGWILGPLKPRYHRSLTASGIMDPPLGAKDTKEEHLMLVSRVLGEELVGYDTFQPHARPYMLPNLFNANACMKALARAYSRKVGKKEAIYIANEQAEWEPLHKMCVQMRGVPSPSDARRRVQGELRARGADLFI